MAEHQDFIFQYIYHKFQGRTKSHLSTITSFLLFWKLFCIKQHAMEIAMKRCKKTVDNLLTRHLFFPLFKFFWIEVLCTSSAIISSSAILYLKKSTFLGLFIVAFYVSLFGKSQPLPCQDQQTFLGWNRGLGKKFRNELWPFAKKNSIQLWEKSQVCFLWKCFYELSRRLDRS